MSLQFSNNDKFIRKQILNRLQSNTLYLNAGLLDFDYSFEEFSTYNVSSVGGAYRIGGSGFLPNTFYLGDFTCNNFRGSAAIGEIGINNSTIWKLKYLNDNSPLQKLSNILFSDIYFKDHDSNYLQYFHFSGNFFFFRAP